MENESEKNYPIRKRSNLMHAILLAAGSMSLGLQAHGQLNKQLYTDYERYIEKSVVVRRFKHNDVMDVVDKLGKDFSVKRVGTSVEGRAIKMISYGRGQVNVLMWSQMHGDETTATRAILDVFRFLPATDSYNDLRQRIKAGITWHFIPMLNPDGASRFTRRNHDGIDINRDAVRLQTPEGRILKRVRDSLKADWGFNLHDQGRGTSVNGKPATISLLAPPFNATRDVNETRGDAMQLTKFMHDQIIEFIPWQVGVYPEDFEPRAFGDNIQKWGTRTILIESGGFKADWEKQEIRRLNFVLLLTSVDAICGKAYEQVPIASYGDIPRNGEGRILDLIITNINYEGLVRDAGFDRREFDSDDFRKYYTRASVSDLGDLSTSSAYITFDAAGYEVSPGSVYGTTLENVAQLQSLNLDKLLREGVTDFVLKEVDFFAQVKVNTNKLAPAGQPLRLGANPSLVFRKNGAIAFALINGAVIDLR